MIEDKDKIKDLFSSKLKNFEPDVPASVWGGLDQLLSDQPLQAPDSSSSSSSSSSAGSSTALKTILMVVGLAAAIITGVFLIPESQPSKEEAPVAKEKIEQPEPEPSESIEDIDTVVSLPKTTYPILAKANKEEPVVASSVREEMPNEPVAESNVEEPLISEKDDRVEIVEEPIIVNPEPPVLLTETKKTSNSFTLGITGNAGLLADDVHGRGGDLMFSRAERSPALDAALEAENSEMELEHRQPVSFGITLSKQIAPRLSLETGLVYTYLSSDIKSNSAYKISESQIFHYLGIPLALNYTFYDLGKAKFYVSLGGMVQKDIRGRYISHLDFTLDDVNDPDIYYTEAYYLRESIKQSNPQFSVKTVIGVSYPLYKKLYLYGTIGGAYYFDAGNHYRTIYTDKKTQLDLNLGIKFGF